MSFPHSRQDYEGQFHSQSELLKRFQAQQDGKAPRQFPEGRLSGDDDGDITFKVGGDPDKQIVAIEFAKPVAWVAMPPQQAIELAQLLIKHARATSREPLRVVLG